MMWRPLSAAGPVMIETQYRTMTLLELDELPGFIANGKRVLLLGGPCGECKGSREDILDVILQQKAQLITDLVVDNRTASRLKLEAWRP
jgi:hypothetical protein